MDREDVERIIDEKFQSNYVDGVPKVAPHRHTGIDNLQINASDILGLVIPGASSPGGSNGAVQYNNNGSFGGDTEPSEYFAYDPVTFTLSIPNITNAFPASATGIDGNNQTLNIHAAGGDGTGDISIATQDVGMDFNDSAPITIETGDASVTGDVGDLTLRTGNGQTGGDINIQTGTLSNANQGDINIEGYNDVNISANGNGTSDVTIVANDLLDMSGDSVVIQGSSGSTLRTRDVGAPVNVTTSVAIAVDENSGNVNVSSGDTTGTGNSGDIDIFTGNAPGSGGVVGNINITTGQDFFASAPAGSLNINVRDTYFYTVTPAGNGTGEGVISIENAAADPSTNPTGGGILYVSGGALMYRGSAGTVTTIAPA